MLIPVLANQYRSSQQTSEARRFLQRQSVFSRRRGSATQILLLALVAAMLLGGGLYYVFVGDGDQATSKPILVPVTQEEFVSKVLDQGEIRSAKNFDIKCNVDSRNGNITVIDVIAEGSLVKEGDWLITLDGTSFEKEIEQQQLEVSQAETTVIQAKAVLETAIAAKDEYLEGIFVERKKQIENEIFDAEQTLTQAKEYLQHSSKLHLKGYITKLKLDSDRVAVARAKNRLDLARKQLIVLKDITKKKELILLNSNIEAAGVDLKNSEQAKEIKENQLAEVKEQLANCKIHVPPNVSGEVVFAKEFDRDGGREWILEPGARVRERQVLIQLPDRDFMEVEVLVNEQSITSIRPNMPAMINVDALHNQTLKGFVTKINTYAEPGDWMTSSSVKEYAVFVRILDPPRNINPGMNATVSIQTQYQADALQIPLQCIYAVNQKQFVLRDNGKGYETVEVEVGGENSINVWIKSGLNPGDQIVMDPGSYLHLMDLPELESESKIELPQGFESLHSPGAESEQEYDSPARDQEYSESDESANRGASYQADHQESGGN